MVQEILKGIYRLEIPMPGNPLKALNSYLIKGEKKHLLIDTGFNWSECREAQLNGMASLGIEWRDVDFFITHFHGDHSGLVYALADEDASVYCSQTDAEFLQAFMYPSYWEMDNVMFIQNGYPSEKLKKQGHNISEFISGADLNFIYVQQDDVIEIGEYHLICVETPGHTPGHMCLYEPDGKFMFSGDHILSGITSNIASWLGVDDSLGSYLSSLDKIGAMDIDLILPGHRNIIHNQYARIAELKQHHEVRCKEILDILKDGPMNGYQVAGHMHWQLNYDSWAQFPNSQQWFATGECIAHLEHLARRGEINCTKKGEILYYELY
jgi:glyoxylase-like metal-dependent hydrolase (beta-lactamase superfamily II)